MPVPKRSILRRLICWIFGHKLFLVGFGGDTRCGRCGKFWE